MQVNELKKSVKNSVIDITCSKFGLSKHVTRMTTRKIQIRIPKEKDPSKTGYFHGFYQEVFNDGDYSQSKPVAIIEFENGEVDTVEPARLRFVSPPKV